MESSGRHEDILLQDHPEGLKILRLGTPDEKAVILSERRMESLRAALERINADRQTKALLILGPSSVNFCAGADVNVIRSVVDPAHGEKLAKMGQQIFDLLANLQCTTVAAISGACVGGGCELVLACDYRIMLDLPESKIGLPEVKLGILPGFGGTVRLPRVVGLPQALDIILAGKVLNAERAKRAGLVDQVVSAPGGDREAGYRALESTARETALGGTLTKKNLSLRDKFLTYTPWGRSIARSKARAAVMKETRGHYPAPLRALDITVNGLGLSREAALSEEAKALGQLIVTPESKSLVHVYFLTERASKLGRAAKLPDPLPKVGVIGGGVMGAGIAACFAGQGFPIVVIEPITEVRIRAEAHIQGSLEKRRSLSPEQRQKYLSQLTTSEDLESLRGASFVVEAIVEDLTTKQEVLRRVRSIIGPDAIIASNTSSLPIGDLSQGLGQPERVVGMHFFNPAEKMPLVEVVRSEITADLTTLTCAAMAARLGKFPVVVEDVPGFLVNRILSPYIAEAGTLLMEGVPIEAIDGAAAEFGMPMGPIRLLDEVGLDVARKVQEILQKAYGKRMAAPDFLQKLLAEGRLGRKSGLGFYKHDGENAEVDPQVYPILGLRGGSADEFDRRTIQDRLMLALINEAVRVLDERVAGQPGEEAAGQIDLATVMGMGFPPFRGGVMRYAERLGAKALNLRLQGLWKDHGDRFSPADGISSRAIDGRSFYAG